MPKEGGVRISRRSSATADSSPTPQCHPAAPNNGEQSGGPEAQSSCVPSSTSSSSCVVRLVSGRFWALSVAWMLGAGWGSGTVARQWLQRHVTDWVALQQPHPPVVVGAPSHCPLPSSTNVPPAPPRRATRHTSNGSGENNNDTRWETEGTPVATKMHRWEGGRRIPVASRGAAPPTRMATLDTSLKLIDNEAFARPLVHRTLLAHPHPQRIAILGAAAPPASTEENQSRTIPDIVLAVLREVLRHTTVQEVVVVLANGGVTPKEFATVVNDPRVRWERPPDHPASWLVRGSDDEDPAHTASSLDVILLAHDDLTDWIHSSRRDESSVFAALAKALRSQGLVGTMLGPLPRWRDSSHIHHRRFAAIDAAHHSFAGMAEYGAGTKSWGRETTVNGAVLFTDRELQGLSKFESPAEIDLKIRQRIQPSLESWTLLQEYLDGATIASYKFPTRLHEELYCRQQPIPEVCQGYHRLNPEPVDYLASSLHVKTSTFGERSGRGVFATQRILKGSYVGLKECLESFLLPPSTNNIMWTCRAALPHPFFHSLYTYFEGYGWLDNYSGAEVEGVISATTTFCNHGCNGTYNIGQWLPQTEQDVPFGAGPAAAGWAPKHVDPFDPSAARRYPAFGCDAGCVALRDIESGEELLDNYLVFGGSESGDMWEMNLADLKAMCAGDAIGLVKAYEEEQARSAQMTS